MTHHGSSLAVLAAALFLGACGSSAPAQTETTLAARDSGGSASRQGPGVASGSQTGSADARCSTEPVYFAFDSSDLDSNERGKIQRSARCIAARRPREVAITGMADPRGTEEYNLALGERRARNVASYIQSLGLDQTPVRVHSVGEEMASGQEEGGWARDRRAEVQVQ